MVFTSLVGFIGALSVFGSGVNPNDDIISYSTYLNQLLATNDSVNDVFYDNYGESTTSVSFYVPILWEDYRVSDQPYHMQFYYTSYNADTDENDYTFIFGLGYLPSWQYGSLRYYVASADYKYVSNFDLTITYFASCGTPYAYEDNFPVGTTSVNYNDWQRSSTGYWSNYHVLNDLSGFDDLSVGFGALVTISINDLDAIRNQITNDAYASGYQAGLIARQDEIYQSGYDTGYTNGYSIGYDAGARSGNTNIMSIMGAIVDTPILILRSLFDYELFGSSIYIVMLSLVTMCAVIWLVRKFI